MLTLKIDREATLCPLGAYDHHDGPGLDNPAAGQTTQQNLSSPGGLPPALGGRSDEYW
jgi:hypothetical protein